MKSSKCLALTGSVLILSSMILALQIQHSVLNAMSVIISCTYNESVDIEMFHATLNRGHTLCLCIINNYNNNNNNNTLQINQSCKRNIRPIWIAETKEIAFELSNLQINDSGTYNCTIDRYIPPPVVKLETYVTIVQIVARPNVSLSCVKEPIGFSRILCSSEGFYPSDLEQVWLRNGEIQNISQSYNTNRTNTDGSFTLHSYITVSSMSDYLNYSCRVNHTSLDKPVMLHLSPGDCYEKEDDYAIYIFALVISASLTFIILIIAVVLKCFRRNNHRSPVSPESVLSHPQSAEVIYSMLGDHRPVQCTTRHNQRLNNTTSTLNTD